MNPITSISGAPALYLQLLIKSALLPALVFALTNETMRAGSATWVGRDLGFPYDWEYEKNWDPNTIPETKDDVAMFAVASHTVIFVNSSGIDPGTMIFNSGASQYTFEMENRGLSLTNEGIINNSGVTQTFNVSVGSSLSFEGNASAGSQTMITVNSYLYDYGQLIFYDNSTAGEATCVALGGTLGQGGLIFFTDKSNADHATLIANPADDPDDDAGYIFFNERSQGDYARVILLGGDPGTVPGQLELVGHHPDFPDVTIGSLEGVGNVTLGDRYSTSAANLIVGSNDLSTTFGGVIWYSYYFLNDGSVTKIGRGTLTLTGANLHRGGTIVKRGKLLVNNTTGSGTGTGPVTVEGGALGGTGIIAGAVTVGGMAHDAILAPGRPKTPPAPLTIQSSLLLNSDATLRIGVNSSRSSAAFVVAKGVTINNAGFSIEDVGNAALPVGTAFTVIQNTATTPIAGSFSNLADGSSVTAGSNTFLASYEGGDGNDLTLTVQ